MNPASPDIRVLPYDPSWLQAYAAFAAREWGPGCRQADPRYIRWAHSNPLPPPAGRSVIWLGVQGPAVIGCIHSMRLAWRVGGELVGFPTLHDWLVAPDFRGGLGTMLLTTALRKEPHAFIPAAAGELEQVYRALRCEPANSSWFRQVLRPASGALRFGLQRALGERGGLVPRPRLRRPKPRRYGEFQLEIEASAALQGALRERLERVDHAGAGAWPEWSAESFAWRFFAPEGPRHLVLHETRAGRVESFCLLSLGVRHGLAIGRFMEAAFADAEAFARLARAAQRALTDLGAHVLLAFTCDPNQRIAFARAGWHQRPGPPSFFSHFPRSQRFGGVSGAGSSIADFGFESLLEGPG